MNKMHFLMFLSSCCTNACIMVWLTKSSNSKFCLTVSSIIHYSSFHFIKIHICHHFIISTIIFDHTEQKQMTIHLFCYTKISNCHYKLFTSNILHCISFQNIYTKNNTSKIMSSNFTYTCHNT